MRGVRHEPLLGADRTAEPVGHLVERARERALLGAALDRCTDLQVAGGDPARRLVQPPDRASELARDHHSGSQAEREHERADQGEAEDVAAHGAMHRRDALGYAHRALDAPAAQDRGSGGEDLRVQCLALPRVLEAFSLQGGGDLRAAAVVGSSAADPALSAINRPRRSTITTRPLTELAAARTSCSEPRRLGPPKRLRGRGRDDVGLARGLGANLRIDSPAQLERQRHLERDDRQHEDIREREQQANAQA